MRTEPATDEGKTFSRRRMMFVIASLKPGGAERVMAQLASHFAALGHDVTLVTLEPRSAVSFYPLDAGVRVQRLGRAMDGEGLRRFWRVVDWIRSLRRVLAEGRPDVVVSFIDLMNVMVLLAARGLGLRIIVSERVDPHGYDIGGIGRRLRRWTYLTASAVVVQTARAAKYFADQPSVRLVTIANPVPPADIAATPDVANAAGRWRIICLGRLDRQKGFELLIRAFEPLASRYPEWDVAIFGEGPERAALQAEIDQRGLVGRFVLHPPTKAVGKELAASHVLALPSYFEGFPNALAEGMAAGLPPIAFKGVSGVEDLIVPGHSGILVERGTSADASVAALSSGLEKLFRDGGLRRDLGNAARARTRDFSPAVMLEKWEDLVGGVCSPSRTPG